MPDRDVGLDQRALCSVQLTRLQQHGVRHTDLADVVQETRAPNGFKLRRVLTALARKHERIRRDAL